MGDVRLTVDERGKLCDLVMGGAWAVRCDRCGWIAILPSDGSAGQLPSKVVWWPEHQPERALQIDCQVCAPADQRLALLRCGWVELAIAGRHLAKAR